MPIPETLVCQRIHRHMLQRQDLLLQLETLLTTCSTAPSRKQIESLLSKVRTLTLMLIQSVVMWRREKSISSAPHSDSPPLVPLVWEGQNILLRRRRDTTSVILALNHSLSQEQHTFTRCTSSVHSLSIANHIVGTGLPCTGFSLSIL